MIENASRTRCAVENGGGRESKNQSKTKIKLSEIKTESNKISMFNYGAGFFYFNTGTVVSLTQCRGNHTLKKKKKKKP